MEQFLGVGVLFYKGGVLLVWYPKEGWTFCSCQILKINIISIIVSDELQDIQQCYLVLEVSMGE